MGCALGLGIVAATLLVHLTISIVAPGDAGTANALLSPIIPILIFMLVGIAGVLIFPVAASLTWPWRNSIANQPVLAAVISISIGALSGYLASFLFADHWYSSQVPGIVAGGAFGLVWALVIRKNAVAATELDAEH